MIWAWLTRLFKSRKGAAKRSPIWPTRAEIALLPPFEGLTPTDIVVVSTTEGAARARHELREAKILGFDTESKPTFLKGQTSSGPHLAQFSTMKRAYVFILSNKECREIAGDIIGSSSVNKVGFGLDDDLRKIRTKLRVEPKAVVDLESLFRARGYGRGVGVKVAVAITFKCRFLKSKKTGTSNWNSSNLSDRQLLYAANDAYASIRVFHALEKG